MPIAQRFDPELVVVSAGFDAAAAGDRVGAMNTLKLTLSPPPYHHPPPPLALNPHCPLNPVPPSPPPPPPTLPRPTPTLSPPPLTPLPTPSPLPGGTISPALASRRSPLRWAPSPMGVSPSPSRGVTNLLPPPVASSRACAYSSKIVSFHRSSANNRERRRVHVLARLGGRTTGVLERCSGDERRSGGGSGGGRGVRLVRGARHVLFEAVRVQAVHWPVLEERAGALVCAQPPRPLLSALCQRVGAIFESVGGVVGGGILRNI